MKTTHTHHIKPKHDGGTNDKSNLIELTIPEHAEAHRLLWEKFGKLEDKCAWLNLSGKTEEGEKLRIELARLGREKYMKTDAWIKNKLSSSKKLKGKKLSKEHRSNISKGVKELFELGIRKREPFWPPEKCSEMAKANSEKMAEARRKSAKWKNSVTNDEYKLKKVLADPRSRKVSINGVIYNSIREAVRNTKMSDYKIRTLAKSKQSNVFFI